MPDDAHSLAVFIDFENLALGLAPRGGGRRAKKTDVLDMKRVLERLVEKGKVVAKKAPTPTGAGSASTRRRCTSSASS